MTTRQIKLMKKNKFTIAALNLKHEFFVVYVIALSVDSGDEVHHLRKAQIAHLKADEASSKVPSKYVDFVDVFSPKLAAEVLEHTRINDHAIEFIGQLTTPIQPHL